ncbi:MAG: ATP-grasp domain-containing protein [Candidatus Aenigmarchaeota archaeon]
MRKIRSLEDLKEIFKGEKRNVIGIGLSAFNRIGPEKFIPDYQIVCLSNGQDLDLIKKDVKVFSVEKLKGKDVKTKRNSSSLLRMEIVKKFLSSFESPYLLFYNVTKKIKKICDEEKWNIIGNKMYEEMDNKALLREILEKCGLPAVLGEICNLQEKGYSELKEKYGDKIVMQTFKGSGGRGTFFVRTRKNFEEARKNILNKGVSEVVVTKFIEGPSPSLMGCVTKHGILYTNLQYQLLDIPEVMNLGFGNGVFCGHDWTSSHDFPHEIQRQAYLYAGKIGEYLKSKGYKGIFGLDMVLDKKEGKIYVIEINPRLLGSFPAITMVQLKNSEPPLIMFHIMEFLNMDYEMDLEKINELIKKPKTGTQLILFNKWGKIVKNKGSLKAGVYNLNDGKLVYKRPGYRLEDLKSRDEFLLTANPPFENTLFKPHQRILRVITLHKIIDKKTYKINEWARNIAKAVYKELRFSV